jgi:hypothetical protein
MFRAYPARREEREEEGHEMVWLVSVGVVTVVVVTYWVLLDVVLDSLGARPPGEWPPTRDGSPA